MENKIVTVGQLKHWLSQHAEDSIVFFFSNGQQLRVAEAFGQGKTYVVELEPAS